jgi:hypothetical protein
MAGGGEGAGKGVSRQPTGFLPTPDRRSHVLKLRRQIPFMPVSARRRSSLAALALSMSCRALQIPRPQPVEAPEQGCDAVSPHQDRTVDPSCQRPASTWTRVGDGGGNAGRAVHLPAGAASDLEVAISPPSAASFSGASESPGHRHRPQALALRQSGRPDGGRS